jgi:hypothetical protein
LVVDKYDNPIEVISSMKVFMEMGITETVYTTEKSVILTGFEIKDSRAVRKNVILNEKSHVELPRKKIHKVTSTHIVFCDGSIYTDGGILVGKYVWKGLEMFKTGSKSPRFHDVEFDYMI